MKKRKLNYRFHDPNPAAVTADYLVKIFVEVNTRKVEAAIQKAADAIPTVDKNPDLHKGHSA